MAPTVVLDGVGVTRSATRVGAGEVVTQVFLVFLISLL